MQPDQRRIAVRVHLGRLCQIRHDRKRRLLSPHERNSEHSELRPSMIDLLTSREFVRFSQDPTLLRDEVEASRDRFVVIDEIQKVPALLAT